MPNIPKLYKLTFQDDTHTYMLAQDKFQAINAVDLLFPAFAHQRMKITEETHFPIADCRPPIAANILDLRR